MTWAEAAVIFVYGLCLAFIFCYSLVQLHLTLLYWLRRKSSRKTYRHASIPQQEWPSVTVQLPVYNERYVVERLITAVAAFDYPSDRLQVQLLDDSTDETTAIIEEKLKQYPQLQIAHIRRPRRTGYKAGALQYGLSSATGEFIAIFDADFLPAPDFLKRTLSAFHSDRVGVVQTRWGHLNQDYSLLTRLQAFGLNAHFTVEQAGRNSGGHFMNFNGTAGIWRKACIVDAGGWKADTLTEDLDLSYRAQLKGWEFKYLEEVEAPAELPAAMGALKSQQFRWTKGAAETARKHLGEVLRAHVPLSTKLHATFHLLNSGVFICVLLTALLSVPVLFIKQEHPELDGLFKLGAVLLLSLLAIIAFYWTALYQQSYSAWRTTKRFVPEFFLFLSISMGLSLHNSLAVLEGYLGRKTPFVRTPKYNIVQAKDSWRQQAYFMGSINPVTVLEGLLTLYFAWGLVLDFQLADFGLLPFHIMLVLGFGTVFSYSLFHSRRAKA
ncbi:cellulose synthase/poly-beta-1,6-N-acetylglucosamine synthase-like glycosyltransferase [Pontibacter ummariensis]|uniref:Glycosyltransferase, catalytic subunit of cellulose synthase and poly-beta-1,6-N-acetylglucosamine synthase n=1 Tax=Pontibacter ummariensis TaxID=1610492 RepID=A0A239JR66_9BACT|nr:cellulose synthase family protein [Pontibacter ummariensis]PRY07388.1 cellulose synthase/poly-beta-1,6-N-acetylglucosamine synthase-like glycosyltransferase [Pontibacter ummariensis]SNT08249.1 Glycosyltransferase, catalytic subunit of cellulose synthase and poly-beta-1,6-N-acetylglucosamine synthase [Pontibacter ummariensis]